jgi:hypothetical protein
MCRGLSILFLATALVVGRASGQPVRDRYPSPDGKYVIEIVGEGGPSEIYVRQASSNERRFIAKFEYPVQGSPLFFDVGLTPIQKIMKHYPIFAQRGMDENQTIRAIYDFGVKSGKIDQQKLSFEDFKDRLSRPAGVLVLHTGTLSMGTWPVVFTQSGESTFKKVYEFDPAEAFNSLKAFKKIPNGFEIAHLYIEVTGMRTKSHLDPLALIFELSCRGDGIWNQHQTPFKSATLDFSLAKKQYLAKEGPASTKRISPEIAGEVLVGNGTGFFVGKRGWILTCYHVVSAADQLQVLISNRQILRCTIVDKDSEHDLALLRVQDGAPAVVPIALDQPALGDDIYTLGFPVPELEGFNPKLTSGIINSLTGPLDDPDY